MKKLHILTTTALAGLTLGMASCSSDFLDKDSKRKLYGTNLLFVRRSCAQRHRASIQPCVV